MRIEFVIEEWESQVSIINRCRIDLQARPRRTEVRSLKMGQDYLNICF